MDATTDSVWDIIIVGGGLGGLSLAVELAAPQFVHLSVLVLEKRTDYTRDRTWSYWTDKPHRYSHLERKRWQQWGVSLHDEHYTHSSQQIAYATLDADAFYRSALQTIAKERHIELRLGSDVLSVATSAVTLQSGQALRARTVLDARPILAQQPSALVQQFAGWEVTTQQDVFEPQSVQLMAFEPDARGLHFWYVLPYSARCALVESTWVSPAQWQPDYRTELENYVQTLCAGGSYAVAYQEQGVLGLQTSLRNSAAPVGLGRNGGTLRAATGYAFLDTIGHAEQLAQSLAAHLQSGSGLPWQPQRYQRAALDTWMDDVFLQVLAQDWQAAPHYFMQIFKQLGAQDAVAFLTGRATYAQRLSVMRSLPVRPFASAAIARLWS
jgi:lycopene beta-cyclase